MHSYYMDVHGRRFYFPTLEAAKVAAERISTLTNIIVGIQVDE